MSFDLNMQFKVETSELDTKAIAGLDKLSKAIDDLSKVNGRNAKAEKDTAAASLTNAKAKEAEAKAAKAAAEAALAQARANSTQSKSSSVSTTVLQRQTDILEFMVQGFSKGQASTLAYAKAAGTAADEISKLGEVLLTQRRLIGGDPFDKSTSGLIALKNQYTELKESIRQYNNDTGLSVKQARELARDKERIIEKMKVEGASFGEIKQAMREYNQQYIQQAKVVNDLLGTEKQKLQNDRDRANAIRAVQREEERMINIMGQLNTETDNQARFSERAAVAQANYARNLRLSGVSAEEAERRLKEYAAQQRRVAAEEEKRQVQYLQRGLQPQIGDVVVSLAGGQNPLTVLLQQGDQIRGLIAQTGVQGAALQKAMQEAVKGTVTSIVELGGAMAQLAIGPFKQLGEGIVNIGSGFIFGKDAIQKWKNETLAAEGLANSFNAKVFIMNTALRASSLVIGLAAASLGVFAIALTGAFFAVQREQDALSKALITTGGSLALTKDSAIQFAMSMESAGVNTSRAVRILTEFAKAGGFSRTEVEKLTPVITKMMDYLGMSAEEAVKSFQKFKKDPVDALIELAKNTGKVRSETILMIDEMVRAGNTSDAVALAVNEAARVHGAAADRMKQDYSTLGTILNETGIFFRNFWEGVKSLIYKGSATKQLEEEIQNVQNAIARKSPSLQQKDIREVQALKETLNLLSRRLMLQKEVTFSEEQQTMLNARAASAAESRSRRKQASLSDEKKMELEIEKIRKEGLTLGLTEAQIQEDIAEYKAKNAKKPTRSTAEKEAVKIAQEANKALERAKTLLNGQTAAQEELTSAKKLELDILDNPNWKRYPKDVQDLIVSTLAQADAKEKLIAKQKVENDLWNEQYKTFTELQTAKDTAWFDQMDRDDEAIKSLQEESKMLDLQLSLVGKTEDERKKAIGTLQAQVKLSKELADINKNDKLSVDAQAEARVEAYKRFQLATENINKEIALDFAQQMQDQMKAIEDGLTDAIVTALFEGGKAGRTKLRDLIVAELRKPITVYVQAVISQLIGGVFGGSTGTGAGSSGGASLGNFLGMSSGFGSAASNLAGGFVKLGINVEKFGDSIGANWIGDFGANIKDSAGTLGKFGSQIGTAVSYLDALSKFKSGSYGEAIGQGIGTWFGGSIGGTIGAAIGKAVDKLFGGKGGPKTESGFGDMGIVPSRNADAFSLQNQGFAKDVSENITSSFEAIAESLGLGTKKLEVSAFTSVDTIGKALTQLQVVAKLNGVEISNRGSRLGGVENVGRSPEELQKAIEEETKQVILGALLNSDLDKTYKDILTNSSDLDQAIATVLALKQFHTALKDLGGTFINLTNISLESSMALIDSFGNVENLNAALSSYYENFYTESERQAYSIIRVSRELANFGLVMPDINKGSEEARKEYRKLVESQDLSTESGRKAYAALLQMSSVFAELTGSVDDTTTSLSEATEILRRASNNIAEYFNKLLGTSEVFSSSSRLSYSKQEFERQYALALSGNQDALLGITSSADAYIQSFIDNATSSVDAQRLIGQLRNDLTALPARLSPEQLIVNAINQGNTILGDIASGTAVLSTRDKTIPVTPPGGPTVQAFASGGVFTNGIVTKPTFFNNSVMGEAGSEAVMPLATMSDGSLGVRTAGNSAQEVQSLKSEIQTLRQDLKAALFAIAKNTGKTAEQLTRWDDGDRMQVSIVQETGETVKTTTV